MSTLYTSLGLAPNEIRVLLLHSNTFSNLETKPKSAETSNKKVKITSIGAPVQCKLYNVLQNDKPSYQALSYTWGDATSTIPITVNGVEVPIAKNLLEALVRIRNEDLDIPLWVDALCINQHDNAEKAEQVKQMGNIYRNATSTIIWLGPEQNDSCEVMVELSQIGKTIVDDQIFHQMVKTAQKNGDHNRIVVAMSAKLSEKASLHFQNLPWALKFLTGCSALWSRPYWSRVWIIQEFVISPSISLLCGKAEISFEVFQAACMSLPLLTNFLLRNLASSLGDIETRNQAFLDKLLMIDLYPSSIFELVGMRERYHWDSDQNFPLFRAICSAQLLYKFKATDDKDLIFGLLGMASDVTAIGVVPDYGRSISCSEVFTSAARAMIYNGDVDLLSLVQHHSWKPPRDVPGWVPDWRSQLYLPLGQSPLLSSFRVSGSAPFFLTLGYNSLPKDQIKLLGYLLNTVELLGTKVWRPPYNRESLYLSREQYLNSIVALCQKSNQKLDHPHSLPDPYLRGNDRASAAARIPVANLEEYGEHSMLRHANTPLEDQLPSEGLEGGYDGAMEAFRSGWKGPYSMATVRYFNRMQAQRYRRGVLLENGLVGTAPEIVKVGDAVVIFKGAKLPYILRKKEEKGITQWTLVGEAYVHGIMYGELFKNRISPKGLHLEEFLIVG